MLSICIQASFPQVGTILQLGLLECGSLGLLLAHPEASVLVVERDYNSAAPTDSHSTEQGNTHPLLLLALLIVKGR